MAHRVLPQLLLAHVAVSWRLLLCTAVLYFTMIGAGVVNAFSSPHFPPPSSTTATTTSVSLNQLLSTCVDACQRGCQEIRAVERKRQASGKALDVNLKDAKDPKSALTEADARAQHAIVRSLQAVWGTKLNIIGEEDDDDGDDENNDNSASASITADLLSDPKRIPLRKELCLDLLENTKDDTYGEDVTVNLADVTVFVDPVDGTREFVDGRLSNCQALVGIALDGYPVAGAIGIPFPYGSLAEESTVVYGQVGAGHGIIGTPLSEVAARHHSSSDDINTPPRRPIMASGDATIDIMVESRTKIIEERLGGSNQLYGGAGNKILATALGYVDCTVQHKYGGPWDTCAPEAILRAMGGRISDLRGEDLVITKLLDASPNANRLGFVATGRDSAIQHEDLIKALNESEIVQAYVAKSLKF